MVLSYDLCYMEIGRKTPTSDIENFLICGLTDFFTVSYAFSVFPVMKFTPCSAHVIHVYRPGQQLFSLLNVSSFFPSSFRILNMIQMLSPLQCILWIFRTVKYEFAHCISKHFYLFPSSLLLFLATELKIQIIMLCTILFIISNFTFLNSVEGYQCLIYVFPQK